MSTDKRKALQAIFAKLEKLLPHLGNANQHEAAAALGRINQLLKSAHLDWHDFIGLLVEQGPSLSDILKKLFASETDLLIQIGLAGAKFFHSDTANWADLTVDGHRHTLPLESPEFREWLLHEFYLEKKTAPKPTSLKAATGLWARMRNSRVSGARSSCVQLMLTGRSTSMSAI